MYTIKLWKYSARRWAFTLVNPVGGCFGSTRESRTAALAEALRSVPLGGTYTIERYEPYSDTLMNRTKKLENT